MFIHDRCVQEALHYAKKICLQLFKDSGIYKADGYLDTFDAKVIQLRDEGIQALTSEDRKARIQMLNTELLQLHSDELNYQNERLHADLVKECADILKRDGTVPAIKYYRDRVGCALMDAKNFIDAIIV